MMDISDGCNVSHTAPTNRGDIHELSHSEQKERH